MESVYELLVSLCTMFLNLVYLLVTGLFGFTISILSVFPAILFGADMTEYIVTKTEPLVVFLKISYKLLAKLCCLVYTLPWRNRGTTIFIVFGAIVKAACITFFYWTLQWRPYLEGTWWALKGCKIQMSYDCVDFMDWAKDRYIDENSLTKRLSYCNGEENGVNLVHKLENKWNALKLPLLIILLLLILLRIAHVIFRFRYPTSKIDPTTTASPLNISSSIAKNVAKQDTTDGTRVADLAGDATLDGRTDAQHDDETTTTGYATPLLRPAEELLAEPNEQLPLALMEENEATLEHTKKLKIANTTISEHVTTIARKDSIIAGLRDRMKNMNKELDRQEAKIAQDHEEAKMLNKKHLSKVDSLEKTHSERLNRVNNDHPETQKFTAKIFTLKEELRKANRAAKVKKSSSASASTTEEQIKTLQSSLEDQRTHIESLLQDLARSQESEKSTQLTLGKFQHDLSKSEEALGKSKEALRKSLADGATLSGQVTTLQATFSRSQNEVSRLKQEIEILMPSVLTEKQKREVSCWKDQALQLPATQEQLAESQSKVEDLSLRLQNNLNLWKTQANSFQEEEITLNKELISATNEMDRQTENKMSLVGELNASREESSTKDHDIANLRDKYRCSETALTKMQQEFEAQSNTLVEYATEIADLRKRLWDCEEHWKSGHEEDGMDKDEKMDEDGEEDEEEDVEEDEMSKDKLIADLQAENVELAVKARALEVEAAIYRESLQKKTSRSRRWEDVSNEYQIERGEEAQKAAELETRDRALKALESERDSLRQRVPSFEEAGEPGRVNSLIAERDGLKMNVTALVEEIKDLQLAHDALKSKLENKQISLLLDYLQDGQQAPSENPSDLHQNLANDQPSMAELRGKCKELGKRNQELDSQNQQLSIEASFAQDEISALKQTITGLNERMVKEEREKEVVQQRLDKACEEGRRVLYERNIEIDHRKNILEPYGRRLVSEIAQLKSEATAELDKLRREVGELAGLR